MTPIRIALARRSDVGRVRDRNEDVVRLHRAPELVIVADGMGGHPGGDVASMVAAERAETWLAGILADGEGGDSSAGAETTEDRTAALERAIEEAHRAVRRRGQEEPHLAGMGTTLTVLALHPGDGWWGVGHAGDSRAYLLRRTGDGPAELRRITRDDTWVQERMEAGELTPEEAWSHPSGHVLTQGVGLAEAPRPGSWSGTLQPGDRFLLCSDGLTDMLPEEEIRSLLVASDELEAVADQLVEAALEAGGRDNVTVGLADVRTDS